MELFFIVHGNNGSPKDGNAFKLEIEKQCNERVNYKVICSESNFEKTNTGIVNCGTRLLEEIVDAVFSTKETNVRLHIIAHSLGGLFAKYAIGLLYEIMENQDVFQHVTLKFGQLVTLCTPHLGSRRAKGDSTFKDAVRIGVHKVLESHHMYGQTGQDLLLQGMVQLFNKYVAVVMVFV